MLTFFRNGSVVLLLVAGIALTLVPRWRSSEKTAPHDRKEVVFWHFWGGRDRAVVDGVVERFNRSQDDYWVRAIAVPGNNFDAKLFLSVVGGNPPDLVNQDDPVLADWSALGVLQSVTEFAGANAASELDKFLLPAAHRLGKIDGKWVAVPNGLDVRAMYYNKSLFQKLGLTPPTTLDEFDQIIRTISPAARPMQYEVLAFLPDPRRIWAWGYAFGGAFFDPDSKRVAADSQPIIDALQWMAEFSRSYGVDFVARYRQTDQTLPGKTFPLLPALDESMTGRYAIVLDGQWRVRDIEEFTAQRIARGIPAPQFDVFPLPTPARGHPRSGWVNGNFFVVPQGAKNADGAWAFVRFWIGLDEAAIAAQTCAAGGWIPVSGDVIDCPEFQTYLREHPLMSPFVELASSDQLFPYPQTRGAMFFRRTIETAAEEAVSHPDRSAEMILREAATRIEAQLERLYRAGSASNVR